MNLQKNFIRNDLILTNEIYFSYFSESSDRIEPALSNHCDECRNCKQYDFSMLSHYHLDSSNRTDYFISGCYFLMKHLQPASHKQHAM